MKEWDHTKDNSSRVGRFSERDILLRKVEVQRERAGQTPLPPRCIGTVAELRGGGVSEALRTAQEQSSSELGFTGSTRTTAQSRHLRRTPAVSAIKALSPPVETQIHAKKTS